MEALKVIASAWSCLFIFFTVTLLMGIAKNWFHGDDAQLFAMKVVLVSLIPSITGVGWLYYRHTVHEEKGPKS